MKRAFLPTILLSAILLSFQNFTSVQPIAQAPSCSNEKLNQILAPASSAENYAVVDCSFSLRDTDVITKQLRFIGSPSSGVTLDCNGATLKRANSSDNEQRILISSQKLQNNGSTEVLWDRPEQIIIKSCKVHGAIRVYGMSTNGEGEEIRSSSKMDSSHTKRAQLAAPRNVLFQNLEITGEKTIPLYLGPGVTKVTLQNSTLIGTSSSVAIYLDAESSENSIIKNRIETKTSGRELIAIDGSSANKVIGNEIQNTAAGGIYLYRNCGEGGTIRHQSPSGNLIQGNIFHQVTRESIHIGSRKGQSDYCSHDEGYPFGSSRDDRDNVLNTAVLNNRFIMNELERKHISRFIVVNMSPTSVLSGNVIEIDAKRERSFEERIYGKYIDGKGNVIRARAKSQALQSAAQSVHPFECQTSSNNNGCFKKIQCPNGKPIIGAKAICNLESGSVPNSALRKLQMNQLWVVRPSDHISHGKCVLGSSLIREESATIPQFQANAVQIGCQEFDKNGGDCEIKGEIVCAN